MSQGKFLLFSILKSGNKNYLNRIKDDLFSPKVAPGDKLSEREMLDVVRKHVLSYRTLPTAEVLRGQGIEYTDTTQPPEYYIDEVKKRAVYLAFTEFQKNIAPHVTTKLDLDEAVRVIGDFNNRVSQLAVSDKFKSLKELGKEIEAELENRRNGCPTVFVPFGWPTLDRMTGGIGAGDLAYFIARPGKGKSQLIAHMSHHAWTQGFRPLVLTMEMTDIQIARRLYGIKGQFNHDALRRGIPDTEVDRRLGQAIEDFDNGPEFDIICGQTRQTVESITSLVDELQPDVVYIDAAYLINMKGSQAKAWEKIAAIGEKLKELAISRNIPIIMTVQFNRDAAKSSKYELDNIAGSDAIGQLGSVIVAIKDPEAAHADVRRSLSIIKNREGGVADFDIHFRFDPPDFSEIMAPTSETETQVNFVM